jgi:acyl-CoA reductase-like NAD-dependent aldehyde dehydrogenase
MIAESLRIFDPSVSGDEAEEICLHQRGAMALGVVGIVAPWNYPVSLALMPLATAIAAGNNEI